MPSRWQREFTCDWCAERSVHLAGELRTRGVLGWAVQWRLCDVCLDRLRATRDNMTYEFLWSLNA